ncbi:MAG: glycerol kinase GlpK [Lysobacterales bacterium]
MADYLLALDQGTSSSRALLFDRHGQLVAGHAIPFDCDYPQPGWVEVDARTLWRTQLEALHAVLARAGVAPQAVRAIGISNQRETVLAWDRDSGEPLAPAIVWQCRRTAADCTRLRASGVEPMLRERTGLLLDPYFSATKMAWLLREHPHIRALAERGRLCFGTVDSWLVWQLTGGRAHLSDVSNASRTLLLDLARAEYDEELLALFGIPRHSLPTLVASAGVLAHCDPAVVGAAIPICGIAGDQQAALFGQACVQPGMAKNTYGTGCFLLQHTGTRPVHSRHGLLSTIAWRLGGQTHYALEGSVFMAGALIQWLRDQLGLIADASETAALAASVPDSAGVHVVPAFVGLGAPYWDSEARGMIAGLTRGAGRAHIVRAALEAVALQNADLLHAMQADIGAPLAELRVDGGMCANDFLMQYQADVLGVPVQRPRLRESTAFGAALLAGLGSGLWDDLSALQSLWQPERRFEPTWSAAERSTRLADWQRAVARARG